MARIIAIDYGAKRTGIAVTDPLGIIAQPLETVATHTLMDFLRGYIARESVERIIVGLPKQMDGSNSENFRRIEPFVNRLRKELPSIPVEYYDERFTSVLAHRAMIDGGVGKMARRDKAMVDRISAAIILQGYMDSKKTDIL
ncbi:MAG: Holliday junction resolvase RuvX [Rikenellaceae bacterium]|jgi:putative Holliday junction resolvase|nr:Holliday junction resolvase RuvX [Rikenellaceae bacterium]MBO5758554.1 Holliday junction resolvase RuvX [Rikenellaceae bacterium]